MNGWKDTWRITFSTCKLSVCCIIVRVVLRCLIASIQTLRCHIVSKNNHKRGGRNRNVIVLLALLRKTHFVNDAVSFPTAAPWSSLWSRDHILLLDSNITVRLFGLCDFISLMYEVYQLVSILKGYLCSMMSICTCNSPINFLSADSLLFFLGGGLGFWNGGMMMGV